MIYSVITNEVSTILTTTTFDSALCPDTGNKKSKSTTFMKNACLVGGTYKSNYTVNLLKFPPTYTSGLTFLQFSDNENCLSRSSKVSNHQYYSYFTDVNTCFFDSVKWNIFACSSGNTNLYSYIDPKDKCSSAPVVGKTATLISYPTFCDDPAVAGIFPNPNLTTAEISPWPYGFQSMICPTDSQQTLDAGLVTCFSGSETIQMESGEVKPISSAVVGQRILAADHSGRISFSTVIAVPHKPNQITTDFVHITLGVP